MTLAARAIPVTTQRLLSRAGDRPGFVFLVVLMLLAISGIVIAAALRRSAMQALVVEDQLDSYIRYHELQGVRSIADVWLLRNDTETLKRNANTGLPVVTQLIDETVYRIYVQDGQGTVLTNLLGQTGSVPQTWLVEMLSRIPQDRPDLTRSVGPWQVSLRSAPDEVIEAMAAGDPAVALALRSARDEEIANVSDLISELDKQQVNGLTAQAIARNLTFDPSLWRIDVEAERPPNPIRRYVLLVERARNVPRTLEWRVLERNESMRGFGPGAERSITPSPSAIRGRGGDTRPQTPRTRDAGTRKPGSREP